MFRDWGRSVAGLFSVGVGFVSVSSRPAAMHHYIARATMSIRRPEYVRMLKLGNCAGENRMI
jgi:hypothetical protein